MAFPTIPTVGAGRVLWALATNPAGTHTSPSLSSLTKNANDLLIAICIIYDGNSTNAEFSSWGGSFTEFGDFATTTTMGIGVAYKWSTGSETGTFTVTSADTSANDSAFCLLSIPGAHLTTPPEAGQYASSAGQPPAVAAALNPSSWDTEDTLWIAVGGSGETGTGGVYTGIASAPTSYTDYADSGISADVIGGVEGAVAFLQLNAASEAPGAWTGDTSSARGAAIVIAVRPLTQVEHAIASDFPLGLSIVSNLSPVEKVISSDFSLGLDIVTNLVVEKLLQIELPLGLTIETNLIVEAGVPPQTTLDTQIYFPVGRGPF